MSVRAIEAEVSIKSGIEAECTIGREVVVEVHDDINLEALTATANGSYRPTQGVDGWDRVTVAVPERQPVTEPLSVTANGNYTPSDGVDGFSDVTVSVPERVPVTESLTVTENGLYEPTEGVDGYDRVAVNVPERIPVTESLSVTENGTYTPGTGVDGYNPVTVNVQGDSTLSSISAVYVGGKVPIGTAFFALACRIFVTRNDVDGTQTNITNFTVESGTIVSGNNTVTVSYHGCSDSVTVVGFDANNIVIPNEYTKVTWISNGSPVRNISNVDKSRFLYVEIEDMLEIQFMMVGSGGGAQAYAYKPLKNNAGTFGNDNRIAFYNKQVYQDLNASRAGMLALTFNAVNTVQIGNNFVKSVELGTAKNGTAQTEPVFWYFDIFGAPLETSQTLNVQNQHMYYIKLLDRDGMLKKYLIPCSRNSDEHNGYFDVISETFIDSYESTNGTVTNALVGN